MRARRDHTGALLEGRDDPRRAAARHRGQGDDGATLGREPGAADEVHLTTDTAVEPVADRIGDDLSAKVDLDGRIDRDHPAERPDDVRVVREVDRAHLDHRVVVDEVVQPPRAHHERGHDLPAVALLSSPRDHPGLDQVDDRVVEHLGMDTEIALAAQGERRRRRDRPDPELDRGAVGDEVGDVLADASLDVTDRADRVLVGRDIALDGQVDLRDVDEAVTQRAGHRGVELDDDRPGGPDRGMHRLDGRPERAEAVGVWRCRIDEDGIERQQAPVEQARHVREEGRDVIGTSLGDRSARVRADEERLVPEMWCHLGRKMRPGPLAMEVDDADVGELRRSRHEGVEQDRRRRRRTLQVELLPGRDPGDGLGRGDDAHGLESMGTDRLGPV